LNLTETDLLSLATTFRLPDSVIPAFHLYLRDSKYSQRTGPVTWEVAWTGKGWAVLDHNMCLNREGEWGYQPQPSSRDEAFFQLYRLPTVEAALEAASIAARLYPNGSPYTDEPPWGLHSQWAELWERYHEETQRQVKAFAEGVP
jgi:hypothetical protein